MSGDGEDTAGSQLTEVGASIIGFNAFKNKVLLLANNQEYQKAFATVARHRGRVGRTSIQKYMAEQDPSLERLLEHILKNIESYISLKPDKFTDEASKVSFAAECLRCAFDVTKNGEDNFSVAWGCQGDDAAKRVAIKAAAKMGHVQISLGVERIENYFENTRRAQKIAQNESASLAITENEKSVRQEAREKDVSPIERLTKEERQEAQCRNMLESLSGIINAFLKKYVDKDEVSFYKKSAIDNAIKDLLEKVSPDDFFQMDEAHLRKMVLDEVYLQMNDQRPLKAHYGDNLAEFQKDETAFIKKMEDSRRFAEGITRFTKSVRDVVEQNQHLRSQDRDADEIPTRSPIR